MALNKPILGVHHLEGHLLSPLLASQPPEFPFIALLVSGGHTQLMRVDGIGAYQLLGETLDDAAGEAFDKSAKLLGLPYPGGPEILPAGRIRQSWRLYISAPYAALQRLEFQFFWSQNGGTDCRQNQTANICEQSKADIARGFVDALVDVLVAKCVTAMKESGLKRLVIAGGVGANRQLRAALNAAAAKRRFQVYYPELEFCTDNGAMIAFAGAMRLKKSRGSDAGLWFQCAATLAFA
jgi:N6-L-threonylcarbamoyladenine synthase